MVHCIKTISHLCTVCFVFIAAFILFVPSLPAASAKCLCCCAFDDSEGGHCGGGHYDGTESITYINIATGDRNSDSYPDKFIVTINAGTTLFSTQVFVIAHLRPSGQSTDIAIATRTWIVLRDGSDVNQILDLLMPDDASPTDCTVYIELFDNINDPSHLHPEDTYQYPYVVRLFPPINWNPINKWTFMVYLDGDNDLETEAIDDFLEMSQVGSGEKVDVIVQFDRSASGDQRYGNWVTTKRFRITQGMTPTAGNALMDIGETNAGDPATLINFVEWAVSSYPSNHYMLVLWDHGTGAVPKRGDDGQKNEMKGLCYDFSSNFDLITTSELGTAMNTIKNYVAGMTQGGTKIDILGFDACLMGMIEVYYQLRTTTDYVIGSETGVPLDGWPYDTILSDITTHVGTISSWVLASEVVFDYAAFYGPNGEQGDTTMAAFRLDLLCNDLVPDVHAFAHVMKDFMPDITGLVRSARENTEQYWSGTGAYEPADLYDFAQLIKQCISYPLIQDDAQHVMDSIQSSCIAEWSGNAHPDAHGVSIYWPLYEQNFVASYNDLDFAQNTEWNEFLQTFYYYT
jgi:hypothetical protein